MAALPMLFSMTGNQVGIICRYKASPSVDSTQGFGHCDAVLSSGEPIGFYGKGGNVVELVFSADSIVRDYALLTSDRPEYVSIASAKAKPCRSTIRVVEATRSEVRKHDDYWKLLKTRAATFRAAGANCATYAAEALESAGILKGGIDGLDTPDHLFDALESTGRKIKEAYGFFGFRPVGAVFAVEYDI